MALIECAECRKEVSDKASVCPHCGYPLVEPPKQPALSSNIKRRKRSLILVVWAVMFLCIGYVLVSHKVADLEDEDPALNSADTPNVFER